MVAPQLGFMVCAMRSLLCSLSSLDVNGSSRRKERGGIVSYWRVDTYYAEIRDTAFQNLLLRNMCSTYRKCTSCSLKILSSPLLGALQEDVQFFCRSTRGRSHGGSSSTTTTTTTGKRAILGRVSDDEKQVVAAAAISFLPPPPHCSASPSPPGQSLSPSEKKSVVIFCLVDFRIPAPSARVQKIPPPHPSSPILFLPALV